MTLRARLFATSLAVALPISLGWLAGHDEDSFAEALHAMIEDSSLRRRQSSACLRSLISTKLSRSISRPSTGTRLTDKRMGR